jgi:hypothetical protein
MFKNSKNNTNSDQLNDFNKDDFRILNSLLSLLDIAFFFLSTTCGLFIIIRLLKIITKLVILFCTESLSTFHPSSNIVVVIINEALDLLDLRQHSNS